MKWKLEKFDNLFDFQPKSKIKAGDGLPKGEYQFFTSSSEQTKFLNEYSFSEPSLIFGTGGNASIHFCGGNFAASTDCFVVIPKNSLQVLPKFVLYYISGNMHILENGFKGAGLKHISKDYINNIRIPLPPLPTQQKIAAILDEADAMRRKDKALLVKYDELLQAVFYDMFGDPVKNEKGWEIGIIRDIVTEVKYGTSKPAEDNGLYPYLRMNNITYTGDWDFSSMKYINLTEGERDKYLVRKGDLVFNRTNSRELVGKTAVYDGDEEMAIAGYLIRVRTNDRANPNYISMYLNSKHGKKTLMEMCKSIIGMANINAQELQEIKVMIPPIDLQNQFASIYKEIQHQKSQIIQQQAHSENLFQSLMQRAFKGELVA